VTPEARIPGIGPLGSSVNRGERGSLLPSLLHIARDRRLTITSPLALDTLHVETSQRSSTVSAFVLKGLGLVWCGVELSGHERLVRVTFSMILPVPTTSSFADDTLPSYATCS
jgi:hypothetical protein